MNLECSSVGDKRFSAMYAMVEVHGVVRTIEEHYQCSKRGNFPVPKDWRGGKGRKPTHFVVGGKEYGMEYFSEWYEALWLKYLCCNPELLAEINKYDSFSDKFAGKHVKNSQADVVQKVHDIGIKKCLADNKFLILLRER